MTGCRVLLAVIGLACLVPDRVPEAAPLFEDATVLTAVMTVPLAQAYRQRRQDERAYVAGHFAYQDTAGEKVRLPLQIRTRGNFRRLNCRLPPLQLNFRKSTVPGTLLAGQDKLKLVGPCSTSSAAEQRVLIEELVYRLFAIVAGDMAFATRRIELAYVDSDKQLKPRQHQTFVIESHEALAERIGGTVSEDRPGSHSALNGEQAALIEVFQYMIGNTDFSLVGAAAGDDQCCHNIKLVAFAGEAGGLLPIPYDFDHAGLVDAPYALPPEGVPVTSVRKRFYMGVCRDPGLIESAVARIMARRSALQDAVTATQGLSESRRRKAQKYLDAFFDIATNPQRVQRSIVDRCRG